MRARITVSLIFCLLLSCISPVSGTFAQAPAVNQPVVEENAVKNGAPQNGQPAAEGQAAPPATQAPAPPAQPPANAPQPAVQPPVSEAAPPAQVPVKPQERVSPPAQQPQTPRPANEPAPVQTPPGRAEVSQQRSTGTVNFFFDDADIYEVIQTIFGEVLKVNYIIDPQVKGRVNFRTVTPIPREEVLPVVEVILRLNGIGFVEEAGLYRIVPLANVSSELVYSQIGKRPEDVAVEMFIFKNLDLRESMPDIENALGLHLKGGIARILPIFRLNALVVVTSEKEQMEYIRKWVQAFDTMFSVARPKIFVYPLQNSKADHVASLLQAIFTGSAPAPTTSSSAPTPLSSTTSSTGARGETQKASTTPNTPKPTTPRATTAGGGASTGTFVSAETKVFADEITNSLIVLAIPTEYAFIEETIKRLDIMPRQVVIEAMIARVVLSDNLNFGVSWALNTDLNITNIKPFSRDINLAGDIYSMGASGGLSDDPQGDGFTFIGTDPSGVVRARLTAALTDSRAKILASPHILVADNREARIQVGQQIPLATSTTTYVPTSGTTGDTNPLTATIQYKDIGIILKVKPQINDSGLVLMELTQEVSAPGPTATIAGQSYSSIEKTETTTNLVAQDGETIVIGGLIREDGTKTKTGIPFLREIPILGNLFGSLSDTTTRTELIILLTPKVVKSQRDAQAVTGDYVEKYKATTKDKKAREFIEERAGKNIQKEE